MVEHFPKTLSREVKATTAMRDNRYEVGMDNKITGDENVYNAR